jgi:squalene-hopene/tetraprenyl-beta-curcumene cyclase
MSHDLGSAVGRIFSGARSSLRLHFARQGMRYMLPLVTCFVVGAAACVLPAQTEHAVSDYAVSDHAVSDHGASWNRKAAAAYLDQRTTWWMHNMGAIDHGTFCVSCHTGLPYALTRSALRPDLGERAPSPTERALLDSVTKRVRLWKEVKPFLSGPNESRGTEAVLNALVLVTYEAHNGMLSDDARQSLDILWAQQIKQGDTTGAWPWFSLGNEPWEAPDSQYWGATLAAVTIGTAPSKYRTAPEIQDNLKLLKIYLQQGQHTQSLLNRLALLWAAKKLPGLLSQDQQQAIINEVLTKQHADGGWSGADLIASSWKRHDGTPQESKSDGYGTGLVSFYLEQCGMPTTRRELRSALSWLARNQDTTTGSWPAYSLNKQRDPATDVGKFMSDAATAYAVAALTSGGL